MVPLGKWSRLSMLGGVGMEIGPYRVGALPCHATLGWVRSTTRVLPSTGVWNLQPYLAKLTLLLVIGMKVGPYRVGALSCHATLGWVHSTTRVLPSTGVWSLQPYLAKLTLLLGIGMKVGPYTVGPSFKSCDLGKSSFYNLYCMFLVSFLWCQS